MKVNARQVEAAIEPGNKPFGKKAKKTQDIHDTPGGQQSQKACDSKNKTWKKLAQVLPSKVIFSTATIDDSSIKYRRANNGPEVVDKILAGSCPKKAKHFKAGAVCHRTTAIVAQGTRTSRLACTKSARNN